MLLLYSTHNTRPDKDFVSEKFYGWLNKFSLADVCYEPDFPCFWKFTFTLAAMSLSLPWIPVHADSTGTAQNPALCPCTGHKISETDLRTLAGSYWHPHRTPARRLWKAEQRQGGGTIRMYPGTSASGSEYSNVSRKMNHLTLSATPTCGLGKFGISANFLKMVKAWCGRRWASSIYQRAYHCILKLARTIADLAGY